MKMSFFLLIGALLLVAPSDLCAQESTKLDVAQLQKEIARREAVERDESTPADLKAINRVNLDRRRAELVSAMQSQIAGLQKYLDTLGDSITPEERETARASLRQLGSAANSIVSTPGPNLPDHVGSGNSLSLKSSKPQTMSSLAASFVKSSPALTESGVQTTAGAKSAPFKISSPSDKDKTSLSTIEIRVKLDKAAVFGVQLKASVKNAGKEVAKGSMTIKAGADDGKLALPLKLGDNQITVSDAGNSDVNQSITVTREAGAAAESADQEQFVDRFSSIYTRGIVGFEQSGASSAASKQKPFLEFFWNPPISTKDTGNDTDFVYPRASLWGSVRLTSVPRQISTPLVTFAPGFLSPFNESNVNDLVQGFDFLVGGEMGIGRGFWSGDIGTICHPTGAPKTCQRVSSYLIGGFGAINPLSPSASVQVFQRPTNQDDLKKLIGDQALPDAIKYIAFTSPDRDSFFRQYYGGFRIKTHYFLVEPSGTKELINRPGAMFDVVIGQNEAVSGGKLVGSVLRLDGFYPLPVSDKSIFYLFGTALINLRRQAKVTDPVLLATAPSNISVPGDNVFVITSPFSNRDFYRIGIGVNLIELFNKRFGKNE